MQKSIFDFIPSDIHSKKRPASIQNGKNAKKQVKIICPVCQSTLWDDNSLVNLHIDSCLQKVAWKESPRTDTFVLNVAIPSSPLPEDIIIEKIDNFPDIWLVRNFITEDEEQNLLKYLDNDLNTPWQHSSFNGHCMQKVFGVRTQFGLPNEARLVRENDPLKGEYGIPDYMKFITERYHQLITNHHEEFVSNDEEFQQFQVNECNINCYEKLKNHYLKYHYDDRYLSGPILMNLSMGGRAYMSYMHPEMPQKKHKILLHPRSLQLIASSARWDYMHGIESHDFLDMKRVSITFRQSGGKHGVRSLPSKGLSAFLIPPSAATTTTPPPAPTTIDSIHQQQQPSLSFVSNEHVTPRSTLLNSEVVRRIEIIEIVDDE